METLKKAEYLIGVETSGENYDGENKVFCTLKIDYDKKSYEIIPPTMRIETNCQFPELVAKAIEKAHEKAINELYT